MAHQALWSGRFREPLSEIALNFSSSIDLDRLLYEEDIAGSIAHVEMLAAARILTAPEARRIRVALKGILKEIQTGKFTKEWVKEYKGGLKNYNKLLKAGEKHQIEKTGAYLRSMMPWMAKKNIKSVQAAY